LKVVGIVYSPRKDGNTADPTNYVIGYLCKKGVETEAHNLFDFKITPCGVRCKAECYENVPLHKRVCPVNSKDDLLKPVRIIGDAESVILATPCDSLDILALQRKGDWNKDNEPK